MPPWLERLREGLAPGIAVEQEIASGGMGHVALGRDTVLDRPVAIKVLQPEKASAVNAERFVQEARRAASLKHPNIVQVHRAGEVAGMFYYIMDYVAGETLARRLERGPLSPDGVVRLGVDLLGALGAAHARHIIHRDVKPSNIFLTRDRALLGDFGIAYAKDSTDPRLTRSGDIVGTMRYLPPEQLHGGEVTAATDIYAAGLVLFEAATGRCRTPQSDPERGDWTGVPEPLREPLRRALQLEPADRWPDTAAFADALRAAGTTLTAQRTPPIPIGVGARAVLGSGAAAALAWMLYTGYPPPAPPPDLVIFPFGTAALSDSTVGVRLAGLTGWSFEQHTDLQLTPGQVAFRLWYGSTLPPATRLEVLTQRSGSEYGAWALVRPRGPRLEVQLRVVDQEGTPFEQSVLGDSSDLPALGDEIASTIIQALFSKHALSEAEVLSHTSSAARSEFYLGEAAFARDAWLTAERHFARALELDPGFTLAAWRLGNVRRWMPLRGGSPYPPGLLALYEADPEALPEVDRHLIEAQFRPSGAPRFARYEEALKVSRGDPYAALLYGDELFHRGPLAGRPLEDAVRMLERSLSIDSTLAPAWEHLAWALIRLGERERARSALGRLERLAGRPEESEIYLPMFLRLAYEIRFDSAGSGARAAGTLIQSPPALALAARGALAFDLAAAQVTLGNVLAASGQNGDQRSSGWIAKGTALMALGRPLEALPAFDSAAAGFFRPQEARFQAIEWRVVPPALGLPGVDEGERERGRAALLALAADSVLGARAAWALALDAFARGDSAAGRWWSREVRTTVGGERLVPLLDGLDHAAGGRWEAALHASEPALAWDSAGYAPDPFLRSALHLLRGDWLTRLGRTAEADRSWLWYENVDVITWPNAEVQPAEVDWALAGYARWLRARLAYAGGRTAAGCALARRVAEVWSTAEPPVAAYGRELAATSEPCRT